MFRVGEACNPGPATWSLSVINPSGIATKGSLLTEIGIDVMAISETHLTEIGQQKFKRELKTIHPDLRFSAGPAVAPVSTSRFCTGGKHSGVGFVSQHPTRVVGGKWDSKLHETARIHAAHFHVDGHWITGGTCYGYSYQSWKASVRAATTELLQQLASKVLAFPGPKFLSGDWNMEPQQSEFVQYLRSIGWQDIQDLMHTRWGIQPVVTCKGSTRKDFLMLCPILQERVVSGQVRQNIFADHAVLLAKLGKIGGVPREPVWQKPQKIEFPKDHAQEWKQHYVHGKENYCCESWSSPCLMTAGAKTSFCDESSPSTITDRYQDLWRHYEMEVDTWRRGQGLPGLTHAQKGRATTVAVQFRQAQPITIKASRHGEVTLDESCPTRLIKSVFLQIRRAVNLQRVQQTCAAHPTPGRTHHAYSLWRAIKKASGFYPSFPSWWLGRPIWGEDTPVILPVDVPAPEVVRCQFGVP